MTRANMNVFRPCLVSCIYTSQAPWTQVHYVWLPGRWFGPVLRRAEGTSKPGSPGTRMRPISPGPGSRDAMY
jgi:hypothetical protein